MLRFARTDWLACAGDVSLKLLEQGIAIGGLLGDVSWDEAVDAYKRAAVELLDTHMVRPDDAALTRRYEHLVHLHHTRGNPSCACRTPDCGHRADEHTGPNGACIICGKECWL